MKRQSLLIACVIMLVGFVAIGAGNRGTATSDDIPVLQTQVAELDARVDAARWQWVGIGTKSVDLGVIPAGTYRVTVSYPSVTDSNWFRVAVQGSKSERVFYWVAAGDPPVETETTFTIEEADTFGLFVSAVEGREAWVIILTAVD